MAKTAMEELIETILDNDMEVYDWLYANREKFIELEKAQIERAYSDGWMAGDCKTFDSGTYYNETYNQ